MGLESVVFADKRAETSKIVAADSDDDENPRLQIDETAGEPSRSEPTASASPNLPATADSAPPSIKSPAIAVPVSSSSDLPLDESIEVARSTPSPEIVHSTPPTEIARSTPPPPEIKIDDSPPTVTTSRSAVITVPPVALTTSSPTTSVAVSTSSPSIWSPPANLPAPLQPAPTSSSPLAAMLKPTAWPAAANPPPGEKRKRAPKPKKLPMPNKPENLSAPPFSSTPTLVRPGGMMYYTMSSQAPRMHPPNLVPIMYAGPNGGWRPQTQMNPNNQYIITTPQPGYAFKPQQPPTSSIAVTSKASTNGPTSCPAATSSTPSLGYTTATVTSSNGETKQLLVPINPTNQQRSPMLLIMSNPDGTQQFMQIKNLTQNGANQPPTSSLQLITGNTLSALQDCPPPPTLSPNPSTSVGLSQQSKSAKSKKRKNGADGAPALVAELPSGGTYLTATNGAHFHLMPAGRSADEPMELSGEDEKPPQIEREGRSGVDRNALEIGLSSGNHQKTSAEFAKVAQIHQRQRGQPPRNPLHFVDGKIVEEQVGPQVVRGLQSTVNNQRGGPPPKQRKHAQPPFSTLDDAAALGGFRKIAQTQVKFVPTKSATKPASKLQQVGPTNSFLDPPPVYRPANYPDPPASTTNGTSKTTTLIDVRKQLQPLIKPSNANREPKPLVGRSPTTTSAVTSTHTPPAADSTAARGRGRPPKSTKGEDSDRPPLKHPSSVPRRAHDHDPTGPAAKRIKSAGNTPTVSTGGPKVRTSREVEQLLKMDFGPGKTPFKTTNSELFAETIFSSQERLKTHVGTAEDGRTSRASISSASNSRPRVERRIQRQESVASSVSAARPRRVVQPNGTYLKMLDGGLESEDEDRDDNDEDETEMEGVYVKQEHPPTPSQSRSEPLNRCLVCDNSPTNPSHPQFCSQACRKKHRVEERIRALKRQSQSTPDSPSFTDSANSRQSTEFARPQSGSRPSSTVTSPTLPSSGTFHPTAPSPASSVQSTSGGNNSAAELDLLRSMGIQSWTAQQTARWAQLVSGSPEVGNKFLEQEIDGAALLFLNEQQLKTDLGLKLGPTIKIGRDLNELKKAAAAQ